MKKKFLLAILLVASMTLVSLGGASAVTSPWSSATVILAKTGNGISVGSAKSTATDLVIPYSFKFGNLTLVANQSLTIDSSPSVLTADGIVNERLRSNPATMNVALAISPAGQKSTVWTQNRTEFGYQEFTSLVSDRFGVIFSEELDFESCRIGGSSYSGGCFDSLGIHDISVVAKDEFSIAVSYKVHVTACSVSSKVTFLTNPENPVATTKTLESVSEPDCDPYQTPDLESPTKLIAAHSGFVAAYWIGQSDHSPKYVFWTENDWSNSTSIATFDPSEKLIALDRSDSFVTFVSATSDQIVQVVDVNTGTGDVALPKFEYTVGWGSDLRAVADRSKDWIYLFYGMNWYRLDAANVLSRVASFADDIQGVYQAPSGRVVVETHSSEPTAFSSFTRNLWVRENGKMVRYVVKDDIFEIIPFAFNPQGDLVAVSSYGTVQSEDGSDDLNDGLKFSTLNLGGIPRIENGVKPTGAAKVSQPLRVTQPEWITYSKLVGSTEVTWLTCSKPVSKLTLTVPKGCNPIRNSSGLTYTLLSGDKGKYITAKLTASNLTGVGTAVLPSIGPVK